MSFFDDEPDEPTRVTRPARPRRSASTAHAGGPPPADIARRRQLILFGGLAIVAIILILFVRSCAGNAKKSALKDYNRNASTLAADSVSQVSKPLFDALTAGGQPNEVQVAVSQVRQKADDEASQARGLKPPGDMKAAGGDLELVLNLRAAAIARISDQVTKALGTGASATDGLQRIAGQMQAFLASDVVYSQRVKPLLQQALSDGGAGGQTTADSKFLPSIGWLDYAQVHARVNPDAGGAATTATGALKPGTHGHGILSVAVAGTALSPGTTSNRVKASPAPSFDVTIANQGQNDESNVKVTVAVGSIKTTKVIPETKAGTSTTAHITLPRSPAVSSAAILTVSVAKVPGEQTLTNNKQTYTILFT